MSKKYITVTTLNKYLKNKFDTDPHIQNIIIKGEISNFKGHTRGHLYFTLKDETSRINAVMFQYSASKLTFTPEDGMTVLVTGRVSIYEATGQYQIYIEEMEEDGLGNLHLKFEQLKKELKEKGLFDSIHKKPIPKYPEKIGIITAPTGAAVRDILTTIKRRYPICSTYLFPSLVQGLDAKDYIVKQIEEADKHNLDVIILGRGGGSIEDLWAFNEEVVANAIFNAKTPIISAVGHEIDFTIADFVADLRAPTPTAAAEIAVPNIVDINVLLNQYKIRTTNIIKNKLNTNQNILSSIKESYILKNPLAVYEIKTEILNGLYIRANRIIKTNITEYQSRLKGIKDNYILKNPLAVYEVMHQRVSNSYISLNRIINNSILDNKNKLNQIKKTHILNNPEKLLTNIKSNYNLVKNKLELLNPNAILSKGYSMVRKDGKIIKDSGEVKIGDIIDITLYKGNINAKIESDGK